MLLLYRVEALDPSTGDWLTLETFYPAYEKSEIFEIEHYGFLGLWRRSISVGHTICNEEKATKDCFAAAYHCMAKNYRLHDELKISASYQVGDGVISKSAGAGPPQI